MSRPKPVEFHPAADAEVEFSYEWYKERSPRAAVAFAQELERATDKIGSNPGVGPEHRPGIHRYLLRRFPYLIFYRERPSTIQIIAVAHGRRTPDYWRDRLSH